MTPALIPDLENLVMSFAANDTPFSSLSIAAIDFDDAEIYGEWHPSQCTEACRQYKCNTCKRDFEHDDPTYCKFLDQYNIKCDECIELDAELPVDFDNFQLDGIVVKLFCIGIDFELDNYYIPEDACACCNDVTFNRFSLHVDDKLIAILCENCIRALVLAKFDVDMLYHLAKRFEPKDVRFPFEEMIKCYYEGFEVEGFSDEMNGLGTQVHWMDSLADAPSDLTHVQKLVHTFADGHFVSLTAAACVIRDAVEGKDNIKCIYMDCNERVIATHALCEAHGSQH